MIVCKWNFTKFCSYTESPTGTRGESGEESGAEFPISVCKYSLAPHMGLSGVPPRSACLLPSLLP